MTSSSDRIAEARERAEQIKRRRIRDNNRENDRQRKIATRRHIIVGEIVAKYFPDVCKLEPKLNSKATNAEFARLEKFVSAIANDPKYAALFQKAVGQKE